MKRILLILCFLAVIICMKAQTFGPNDFAHGFSAASKEANSTGNGSVSYTYGLPFFSQVSSPEGNSLSEGVMHAQLIRLDMVLDGCRNDSLAASPSHVKDTSGFFLDYEGVDMVFRGETIKVFPAGTYDSTGYESLHYNWNSQYNYDSLTTLLLKVYPIYELFDTLYLDSAEIVTDYASNELHIPSYAWHQLHGGPNEYDLNTVGHGCDSIRHFFVNLCGGTVLDADGNSYASLYIGTAPERYCWTKSNLKTTQYVGGGDVPNMMYYGEGHTDREENVNTYGRLYTWYAAVNLPDGSDALPPHTVNGDFITGICPSGWHIPDSLNMESLFSMDALDLMSDILWLIPGHDTGAGFYALPAGYFFHVNNRFEDMLGSTYFWSSVKHSYTECWVCSLMYGCNRFLYDDMTAENGVSVRCVKNQMYDTDGNELNN